MNTHEKILEATDHYIQKFGFEGFSYSDLAEEVGIRKASIHYYFPNKADLGIAYCQKKLSQLIQLDFQISEQDQINQKIATYLDFFYPCAESKLMCGIHAMSTDLASFSFELQQEVKNLLKFELDLLKKIFDWAKENQAFKLQHLDSDKLAMIVVSTTKNALIMNRIFDNHPYQKTIDSLQEMLM